MRRITSRYSISLTIEDGVIDQADVVDIEAEAVLRLARKPEGYGSESDRSYTYRFDQQAASGKLEILASEWETLGIRPSKMFAIVPTPVRPR